jgi:chemotaxis protein MotA
VWGMDFTGLIGLIAGLFLVYFGITTSFTDPGAIKGFIDYPSMAITFGGTIASTVIAFPISFFKKIPSQLKITLQKNKYDPKEYIATIVDFAQEARKRGLLSLEEKANGLKFEDSFLKESILLIVDAIEPEKVKQMLDNELNNLEDRHAAGWGFYEKASTFAPAFGMIGTLIGLINMLANLDMSSDKGTTALAQGMSTALVTTFYGSMMANLILVPIGNKLHMRHNAEMLCKEIVVEGVTAIQAGESPKQIEERLNTFLNQKLRGTDEKPSPDSEKNGNPDGRIQ